MMVGRVSSRARKSSLYDGGEGIKNDVCVRRGRDTSLLGVGGDQVSSLLQVGKKARGNERVTTVASHGAHQKKEKTGSVFVRTLLATQLQVLVVVPTHYPSITARFELLL